MGVIDRGFSIVPGLHSEQLAEGITGLLFPKDYSDAEQQLLKLHYGAGDIRIYVHKCGDMRAKQTDSLRGQDVYIVQDTGKNCWQDLTAMCLAAEEARRGKAHSVTCIVPVWRFGRYEGSRSETGSAHLVARMLKESGIDRLVTLTPTQALLSDFYPVEVVIPDIASGIRRSVGRYWGKSCLGLEKTPVVMAAGVESVAEAEKIASALGWDIDLSIWEGKKGWRFGEVWDSRCVLVVSSNSHIRLGNMAERLNSMGVLSVGLYLQALDSYDAVEWNELKEYQFVLSPDSLPGELAGDERTASVDTAQVLAEWLLKDRQYQ